MQLHYEELHEVGEHSNYSSNPSNRITRLQPKCNVCFRTSYQTQGLSACGACGLAFWCSDKCKEQFLAVHPDRRCAVNRDIVHVDRVKIDYKLSRKGLNQEMIIVSDIPQRHYRPLSTISSWNDFVDKAYPILAEAARLTATTFRTSHPKPVLAVRAMMFESLSIPITILSALETVISDLPSRRSLAIHVVGAAGREQKRRGAMEELLHLLPKLKDLQITFVGPEVILQMADDEGVNRACPNCPNRKRTMLAYSMPYHQYLDGHQITGKPDLICAFNTGFSEESTALWEPSLLRIIDSGIPALFTTYNKPEAIKETIMWMNMGANVVSEPVRNKWSGVEATAPEYGPEYEDPPATTFSSKWSYIICGQARAVITESEVD
jgi:splicing suppressor protein 51